MFSYDDLYYQTEDIIYEIIEKSNNEEIRELYHKFKTIKYHEIPNTQIDDIKIRDINPLFKYNDRVCRFDVLDSLFDMFRGENK